MISSYSNYKVRSPYLTIHQSSKPSPSFQLPHLKSGKSYKAAVKGQPFYTPPCLILLLFYILHTCYYQWFFRRESEQCLLLHETVP